MLAYICSTCESKALIWTLHPYRPHSLNIHYGSKLDNRGAFAAYGLINKYIWLSEHVRNHSCFEFLLMLTLLVALLVSLCVKWARTLQCSSSVSQCSSPTSLRPASTPASSSISDRWTPNFLPHTFPERPQMPEIYTKAKFRHITTTWWDWAAK